MDVFVYLLVGVIAFILGVLCVGVFNALTSKRMNFQSREDFKISEAERVAPSLRMVS